jgi:two-component system CheB/CheR fusion protein
MGTRKDRQQACGFHVVGIGTSAGDIQPLRRVFASLPEKPGLAFIIVPHLAPDQPSMPVDVLAAHSRLPVYPAADGMPLQVDSVYLAAANEVLTLEDAVLRSRPIGGRIPSDIDSIDILFESLANACGPKAVGIVLSGTGSDGAAGVVHLKQAGGRVFAQDPITAMHEEMPCAAIATGLVDHVTAIEGMAHQLLVATSPCRDVSHPADAGTDENGKALHEILAQVQRYADFVLSGYKAAPLLWRIQHRMSARRITQFSDYRDLLIDDAAELEALILRLPIHVTAFFRDEEAWSILQRDVIEALVAQQTTARPIRVRTPACSTGEEVYSVAMLLAETAGRSPDRPVDFQLFASDASPEIVARASRGQFPASAVEAVGPQRRTQFSYPVDGRYG